MFSLICVENKSFSFLLRTFRRCWALLHQELRASRAAVYLVLHLSSLNDDVSVLVMLDPICTVWTYVSGGSGNSVTLVKSASFRLETLVRGFISVYRDILGDFSYEAIVMVYCLYVILMLVTGTHRVLHLLILQLYIFYCLSVECIFATYCCVGRLRTYLS